MTTAMLRVSPHTRERVMQVAADDYAHATADETVNRLLDEHWQAKCVEAVTAYRGADPQGWAQYLGEAEEWDEAGAPVADSWDGPGA
jgi:hypothetical protein